MVAWLKTAVTAQFSPTGICTGAPTCQDHFDETCELAEYDCRIHKHQLCDGTVDCSFGKDESRRECDDDLMTTWNCSRRLGDHVTRRRIPKSWVCDGVQDCLDNEDEDTETLHKQCFTGGNGKSVCIGQDAECPVCSSALRSTQTLDTLLRNCVTTLRIVVGRRDRCVG